MRIIYTSDLHSNELFYYQLLELINSVNADELIIGGDLFAYTRSLDEQLLFMDEFLVPFLKSIDIPIYLIAGNTDLSPVYETLRKALKEENYKFLNKTPQYLKSNIPIFGFPLVTPTPFRLKNFERRDLATDTVFLDSAYIINDHGKQINVTDNYLNLLPSIEEELDTFTITDSIWVTHVPPSGGLLDILDKGKFAGSQAIRDKIKKEKPLLTLHGHIHEAPRISGNWIEEIGGTISINAGQGTDFHAVIIDIDSSQINIKHTIFGYFSKKIFN